MGSFYLVERSRISWLSFCANLGLRQSGQIRPAVKDWKKFGVALALLRSTASGKKVYFSKMHDQHWYSHTASCHEPSSIWRRLLLLLVPNHPGLTKRVSHMLAIAEPPSPCGLSSSAFPRRDRLLAEKSFLRSLRFDASQTPRRPSTLHRLLHGLHPKWTLRWQTKRPRLRFQDRFWGLEERRRWISKGSLGGSGRGSILTLLQPVVGGLLLP